MSKEKIMLKPTEGIKIGQMNIMACFLAIGLSMH